MIQLRELPNKPALQQGRPNLLAVLVQLSLEFQDKLLQRFPRLAR